MHHHYASLLRLNAVAREAGVSLSWLTKHFRRTFGQSPNQYLQRLRMQRARELLKDPAQSIAEIARAVGYRSPQAFYRIFTAHTGNSPGAFRSG